ncbi:MAG: hypothetical protein ABI947_09990 [Chloroflexota bacterium]
MLMNRVLLYANWILVAGGALSLLVSLLCLVITIVFGEWNSSITLYWLTFSERFYDDLMSTNLWAFVIIGVLFAVLAISSYLLAQAKRYSQIGARAVFLALFAVVLTFGIDFVRFFQFGPFGEWEHLQTINLNNHVYHLLLFAYDKSEITFYRFYECDQIDLFCQELYSTVPIGSPTPPNDKRIVLVVNSLTKAISLQVYGEIVYTRQPQ